jgi:hypothetical protein
VLIAAGQDQLGEATTDAGGAARFAPGLLRGKGAAAAATLAAYGARGDFAVLDLTRAAFDLSDRGVSGRAAAGAAEAFVYAERGVYRPGETVNVMALLRDRLGDALEHAPLALVLRRPDGVEAKRFSLPAAPQGGFHQAIALSRTAAFGVWSVEALVDPASPPVGRVQFDVQDFVPQMLKVTLAPAAAILRPNAPIEASDYGPRNFDRIFHGPVTAREALQQSYNSPAVQLLAAVDAGRFAATLRMAGAQLAFPDGESVPGLPLALGGVGVDLGNLTVLYAALADGGRAAGLRFHADAPSRPAAPLMTETAARQVQDMLRGVAAPDGVAGSRRGIAYKTGTSYGFRDALAIGSSAEYTVAVWVGRTEGTPRPGSYGRNTAAPLLFRVFDLLPPEAAPPPAPVVQAGRSARAASLRRLARVQEFRSVSADAADALRIVFPPAGARIQLAGSATVASVPLEATGGVPPYHWAINGQPLPPAPIGAAISWRPDGPGFATVSVSDSRHHATAADFRVEP